MKHCKLSHGHDDQSDTSISDIVEVKEMDEIVIHDHIKTRWINLYPLYDNEDGSDLQLLCSHLCIA